MIKYSVIIPAYQCANTLESTVKSVLSGGLRNLEIIIVNDGSTDGTKELCDKLAETYNEVIAIHRPNSGVSVARNRGITEARGEYILFMDSDDSYTDGALARAAEIIEREKPDMLIFGLSFDYYKNGIIYRSDELYYSEEGIFTPQKWSEAFSLMFETNSLSSACNKIFKADIIRRNGLNFHKDVFIMEDFLFVLDYLRYVNNIYMLPEAIYRYRQPDDEARAFKRMERVEDLNTYLIPFYNSIDNLSSALSEKYGLSFPEGEATALRLYSILLNQKAYYADMNTLKELSCKHQESKWADTLQGDALLTDLKNGNCLKIYLRNKITQLRHTVAVQLKKSGILH